MGRELQKKKNRSSLNKVRRKPKSKKKHFGNHIIAANWDKNLTLSQNYRRLGLAAGLNRPTGGTEKTIKILQEREGAAAAAAAEDRLAIRGRLPAEMATREARVERDPETGEILRVLEELEGRRGDNPLNDPLNELDEPLNDDDDDDDDDEADDGTTSRPSRPPTHVVQQLERLAASEGRKDARHQSAREVAWIEALVARHGDDYARMVMDGRLNPMQQSAGQIRRKVLRWRKSRGE